MIKYALNLLPFLAFIFMTDSIIAQNNQKGKRTQNIIWFASAETGYNTSDLRVNQLDYLNTFESQKPWIQKSTFSSELKIGRYLKNNLYLVSGIRYKKLELGILTNPTLRDEQFEIGTNESTTDPKVFRNASLRSLEIPLEIRKDVVLNRFSISPSFGINVGVNLQNKEDTQSQETDYVRPRAEDLTLNNKLNVSTTAKLELAYSFSNRMKLKVAAIHNFYLVDEVVIHENVQSNLQSYGLQVGFEVPLLYDCPYKNFGF